MWLAEGLTAINKDNSADFLGEKSTMKKSGGGVSIFWQYTRKL